jgi:Flp pilus assembly protein TadG
MRRRTHGVVIVYATLIMTILVAFAGLAVDWGRVQLVETEMQRATDAAARFGAAGLRNILNGTSAAYNNAITSAAENKVDGTPLVLTTSDIELGQWNTTYRTFTASSPGVANAVRVTAHRSNSRGTAVRLTFGGLFGAKTVDVSTTAIAMLSDADEQTISVPATSNPFLAGMPSGSMASPNNPHNSPDYAGSSWNPKQSPPQADDIPVTPGKSITFDGVNGGATNDYNDDARYTADGNTGWVTGNTNGNENGIGDVMAPGNSLIGVFLSDSRPSLSAAPSTNLDFSDSTKRNFSTLSPGLKQLFFIGDGRRDNGDVQQFVVPTGATRLFIGTWDSYEWNNNIGTFTMTVHTGGTITLVK